MELVMKKIAQVLALALLATIANQAPAVAADLTFPCGSGGTYSVEATYPYELKGNQNCSGSVTLDGRIRRIAPNAFKDSLITEIIMPADSVQYIGYSAFANTTQLKSIRFSLNLETINFYVFEGSAIENIELPPSINDLDSGAFRGSSVKSIDYCGGGVGYYKWPVEPTCRAIEEEAAATQATQDAKKLTISCIKGGVTKKVRGESPNCPKGYVNPMAKYLTFQAFSKCRLYKKDAPAFNASLSNSGKTLYIQNPYNYDPDRLFVNKPAQVSFDDLDCAFDYMGANDRVRDVYSYKATKGVRTIRWGRITLKFEISFLGLTYYTFTQN
jgi:hypothetical protein